MHGPPARSPTRGHPGSRTVGREHELAVLDRRLLEAQRGRGGLLVVTGEAGIGKSRMLAEADRRARARGIPVLTGRAVEGAGAFRPLAEALLPAAPATLAEDPRLTPYRPVLARLLPGWPAERAPVPSLVDPLVEIGEAVLALLTVLGDEGRSGGVLLLLDDLHWADRDTLALLGYLAGRLTGAGVLAVAAARDDDADRAAVGQLLRHPGAEALPLTPLGPEDVLELAADRAGTRLSPEVARFVTEASDGLPLLVEELVEAVEASGGHPPSTPRRVPRTLAALTARRLARLPPTARDVVRAAAVLGGGVDWRLLPAVSGADEGTVAEALRLAVDAQLVVPEPAATGGLHWRHALTKDAVLATLLPPERAALARRAVGALCGDDPARLSGERLVLVTELMVAAGQDAEAAGLLLRIARDAVAAGALRTAEDALLRALDLAGPRGGLRTALTVEHVRVLALAGRPHEAEALGDRVLDTVHGERRVELCLHMARAAAVAERFADAARHLAPVAAVDDARVQALRAAVALGRGDLDDALAIAGVAVETAERDGRHEAACEALEVVGRCLRRVDPAAAERALDRSERLADRHGLHVWRVRALSELGAMDLLRTGRSDRLEEARRLAVRAGMLATAAVLDVQLSGCVSVRDGHVAALPYAIRGIEAADRLGLPAAGAAARFFLALARLCAGDAEPVEPLLAEAAGLAPDLVDVAFRVAGVRAWAAWLDGDDAAALDLFDRAVAPLRGRPDAAPTPYWGQWALLRTLATPGDARAADHLRQARVDVQAGNRAALAYVEAIAAARAGRADDAGRLFAVGDEAVTGHPYWRHVLHLMMAGAAAEEGFGAPERWLRAALADLEPAGEVALARRCREQMRRLGLPLPRTGRNGSAVPPGLRRLGVTAREAEVLELVRQGMSNPQIAARLVLSVRTVETHVANLLAKLGVRSRTELRGAASVDVGR
ncbi:ATP-binding protein [Blastococcus deserti]|uniref:ATP-binding protein n=1 Tax=Blastococcus deserti TaxID=2259033 RepID=A0ABW4X6W8_9ACTN